MRRCRSGRWSPRRSQRFGSDPSRVYHRRALGRRCDGRGDAGGLPRRVRCRRRGRRIAGRRGERHHRSLATDGRGRPDPFRRPPGPNWCAAPAPAGFPGPWPRLSIWHGDGRSGGRPGQCPHSWPSSGRLCMDSSRRQGDDGISRRCAAIAGPAINSRRSNCGGCLGCRMPGRWTRSGTLPGSGVCRWINRRAIRHRQDGARQDALTATEGVTDVERSHRRTT